MNCVQQVRSIMQPQGTHQWYILSPTQTITLQLSHQISFPLLLRYHPLLVTIFELKWVVIQYYPCKIHSTRIIQHTLTIIYHPYSFMPFPQMHHHPIKTNYSRVFTALTSQWTNTYCHPAFNTKFLKRNTCLQLAILWKIFLLICVYNVNL